MDAKRIGELRDYMDAAENEGFLSPPVSATDVRLLLDAYESLQRIAELPERWQSKLVVSGDDAIDSCADELQQALPEGFRK